MQKQLGLSSQVLRLEIFVLTKGDATAIPLTGGKGCPTEAIDGEEK